MTYVAFVITGVVAGFIDSIAGGGGLITLPVLSFYFGLGPHAIGTNKIVGFTGAFVAFLVYLRKGHFDFRKALNFTLAVSVGSFLGGSLSPFFSKAFIFYVILLVCPFILFFVFKRQWWMERTESMHAPQSKLLTLLTGLIVGFYDGSIGPGGGTFMFLGLYLVANVPLLLSLGISKLVNTVSAAASFSAFYVKGYVHWKEGLIMACGMLFGSLLGSHLATQKAAQIVRPMLLVIVILLLAKLGLEQW